MTSAGRLHLGLREAIISLLLPFVIIISQPNGDAHSQPSPSHILSLSSSSGRLSGAGC
jgi:hypothetical protein